MLLLQFPLADSLPGKTDCWYHVAISNEYRLIIQEWFAGVEYGTAYYPAKHLFLYGEPAKGGAMIYLLIDFLVSNPVWSWYFFYTFLFAMNSLGVYLVARKIDVSLSSAIAVGLMFSCANYTFGQLDHQNTLSWYPGLFALNYLLGYLRSQSSKKNSFSSRSGQD